MPQGRLLETSEIIFVKSDEIGSLQAVGIGDANGIAFKASTGQCWWIGQVSLEGAFGTRVGSVWGSLLSDGYTGFSRYQFSADIKAHKITESTYTQLLHSMGDISKNDTD